jgi:hypothetical protein
MQGYFSRDARDIVSDEFKPREITAQRVYEIQNSDAFMGDVYPVAPFSQLYPGAVAHWQMCADKINEFFKGEK